MRNMMPRGVADRLRRWVVSGERDALVHWVCGNVCVSYKVVQATSAEVHHIITRCGMPAQNAEKSPHV